MIKIKRTIFDHINEKNFERYMFINPEQIQALSGNILIRMFNHILPITYKFLRETFNATENNRIMAQISLVPDKFSKLRFQISSLKIRNGNNNLAKPLIDFVVSKYGGSGVLSFLVYIDENNTDIISLFKNECGFRSCAKIEFYKKSDLKINNNFDNNNFRNLKNDDILNLLEINTMNIFPHFRPALISKIKEFKRKFLRHTKNDIFKVFAINDIAEGYFRLYDKGNGEFYADIITSKPYEQCYEEIINYIENYLAASRNFTSLTILLKKYRETSSALQEALDKGNYDNVGATHIFVKDYWQKINNKNDEKLLFFLNDFTVQAAKMTENYTNLK